MSKFRPGKYFIIHTKINPDLVVELSNNEISSDIRVAPLVRDWVGNNEHQLWFYNYENKSIVNKKYNSFLDVEGNQIVAKHQKMLMKNENWIIESDIIKAQKANLLMEMNVDLQCVLAERNAQNILQCWKIEKIPALFFYIKPKDNPALVIDVKGDNKGPGAKVILYENKGNMSDNQLWYEDEHGFLHSKMNDYVLDLTDKQEVVLNPYQSNVSKQQWVLSGSYIRNLQRPSMILQMKPGNVFTNHRVVVNDGAPVEGLSQWVIEFIEHQSISLSHSGTGRNFLIRSMMSGLGLEVEGESINTGNRVILGRYHEDPSKVTRQHFYQDNLTDTIRSVLRNFVLEATDMGLKLSSYDPYNKMQMWKLDTNKLRNKHDTNLVLQVNKENNSVIIGQDSHNTDQLWEFCFMPAKYFYIMSVLCEKVLDVRGCNASSGASVILYSRNQPASDNQLWYEDELGLIRSKLNGYVLDSSDEEVRVMPFDPKNKEQQWFVVGDRIQNKYESKMVIDIGGENKRNGASLIKYKFHGGENQRWKFDYVT